MGVSGRLGVRSAPESEGLKVDIGPSAVVDVSVRAGSYRRGRTGACTAHRSASTDKGRLVWAN